MDELIGKSFVVPMSGQVLVQREAVLELIDQIRAAIPDDVQHADEVLRVQEEILAEAREAASRLRAEAEAVFQQRLDQHELTVAAREQAKEIMTKGQQQAEAVLVQADNEAAARRKELDEYSLALLRRLEANLASQLANVRGGIDAIVQGTTQGPGATAL